MVILWRNLFVLATLTVVTACNDGRKAGQEVSIGENSAKSDNGELPTQFGAVPYFAMFPNATLGSYDLNTKLPIINYKVNASLDEVLKFHQDNLKRLGYELYGGDFDKKLDDGRIVRAIQMSSGSPRYVIRVQVVGPGSDGVANVQLSRMDW